MTLHASVVMLAARSVASWSSTEGQGGLLCATKRMRSMDSMGIGLQPVEAGRSLLKGYMMTT